MIAVAAIPATSEPASTADPEIPTVDRWLDRLRRDPTISATLFRLASAIAAMADGLTCKATRGQLADATALDITAIPYHLRRLADRGCIAVHHGGSKRASLIAILPWR